MAAGTAYLDELRTLDFGGAAIQYKVIFEDLPTACMTDGGRAFIDEFRNQQVAHIKVLYAYLQSLGHLLDHLLDACTIFLHSISRKLVNPHAGWSSCTERVQCKHWFEWAEKAVYSALPKEPARDPESSVSSWHHSSAVGEAGECRASSRPSSCRGGRSHLRGQSRASLLEKPAQLTI